MVKDDLFGRCGCQSWGGFVDASAATFACRDD
jgi:hypothetical protein